MLNNIISYVINTYNDINIASSWYIMLRPNQYILTMLIQSALLGVQFPVPDNILLNCTTELIIMF